jgi:acetyltransferase-like isoleucine patch superfamily enzyme
MNILNSIKYRIQKYLAPVTAPVMIGLKRDFQGNKIYKTRISSSTFIDNPKTFFLSDNIFIGHYNYIEASGKIIIEEGVQITNFCSITTHSSHQAIRLYGKHYTEFKQHEGYVRGDISIGKYSFIGPHSVITPNTHIGKGSIVAAFSYVKGDFPDFAIIAGNPAKVIGFTGDKDAQLLEQYPHLQQFYQEWSKL